MFGNYTWGDFGLFVACLLVVYYIGVALIFYRQHILALVMGQKLAPAGPGPSPHRSRAAAADDDLVTTTSAYNSAAKAPAAEPPTDTTEPGAGAADNLTGGQEQLVAGSLPDSVAATGDNVAPAETATAESAGGAATGDAAQEEEEEMTELLPDEVPEETRMKLAAISSSEKTTKGINFSENAPTFVDDQDDIPYVAAPTQSDLLEEYDVPITSSLNIKSEQAAIFSADDLNSFLTELQDGPVEAMAEKFAGTTLGIAEEFSQRKVAVEDQIAGMFAGAGF